MVTVQRLNVVLDIDEDSLPKYLSLGYNQVDPHTGKVINASIPTDAGILRLAYVQHMKEIEELKAKISELEAKADKPTKTVKKSKPKAETAKE